MCLAVALKWYLLVAFLYLGQCEGASPSPDLFFTSTNDIQEFTNRESRVVINDPGRPLALDCNMCDRKIYWINQLGGKIRRGSPGDKNIEDVLIHDIINPRGIAVDYIGNNIYFSHETALRKNGRLEVATCDGRYRRVLRTKLEKPGPIALDITRGYLYYLEGWIIYRIHTDGSGNAELVNILAHSDGYPTINGLAVDVVRNTLFWSTTEHKITSRNLVTNATTTIETHNIIPYGLAAGNGELYWTRIRNVTGNVPGAIFYYNVLSGLNSTLYSDIGISPLDISSSDLASGNISLPTTGCADNNGGCSRFCFMVPRNGNPGNTMPKCGCPTGIELNGDGKNCAIVPDRFVLFGRAVTATRSEIRMVSLDTAAHTDVSLPLSILGGGAHFVAYATHSHSVYWDETSPPAIRTYNIETNEVQGFLTTDVRYVSGIAVDTFSRNLYWVDSVLDRISVATIGRDGEWGGVRRVIVMGDIIQPQGLALDLTRSVMYWVDLDSNMPRVEQARLDGTERESVMTDEHIIRPTTITVDAETGAVYWADAGRDASDGQVVRYHDNEAVKLHVGGSSIHGLSFLGGYLYWSNGGGSEVLRRGGDGVSRDFVTPGPGVHGISAVNVGYHVNSSCENRIHHTAGCSHLCLPSNRTHGHCACPDGYVFRKNSVQRCEDSPATFFFSLFSPHSPSPHLLSTYRVPPNNKDDMWDQVSLRQTGFPVVAMAIDLISGSIYYISSVDKLIYQRRWNRTTGAITHSNATLIVGCCLATPEDLAVDWLGRNLYWSDSERGVIEVAKLDGSGRRVIAAGLERPTQIVLYPRGVGYVYWIPKNSQSIRRTRMDGTPTAPVESLFWTESRPQEGAPFLNLTVNLTASVDYRLDRILWSTQADGQVRVWSLSLAPGMRESMPVREPNSELTFTAASIFYGVFYVGAQIFTESIGVFELGLTSTYFVQDYQFSLGDTVVAMEFAHHTSQPGIHECPYICDGYSPICLVQNHIYGTCNCPSSGFKIIGHDSFVVERESCAEAKSFLVWATPTSIYIYALPSNLSNPQMSSKPQLLPIALNGSVVGLTFDPRDRSVVWMDSGSHMIQSVSIDGTASQSLTQLPGIRPDSMSLDWIGGQLFFTEKTGFQVEAVSVRGEGVSGEDVKVGSVMSAYGQEKGVINDLYKPKDVLYDRVSTTLYWNGGGREIFKMSLNNIGTRVSLGVAKETRSVEHLSLDEASRWMFWVNEKQGIIEGMSLLDEKIITIVEWAWNISAMTASSITESKTVHTGYLFWLNGTDQILYHCNTNKTRLGKDCVEKKLDMTQIEGGIVSMVSFDQYRVNFLDLPYRCRTTRSCDYLCIEDVAKATMECACPLYREPTGNGKCSKLISCGVHQWSCDNDLECFPFAYFCDGIDHCTNGQDEMNCSYCPDAHLPCSPTSTVCYPNSSRCDQTFDCPSGEDESLCCRDTEFGCYVTEGTYMCFQKQLRCGPEPICMNGEDRENCPPSSTPSTTPPPSESNTNITLIATVATIIVVIALVILTLVLITTVKCLRSSNKFAPRIPSFTSPTLRSRSDSISLYSTGISSLGTESTNFGNCSSPHTDSFCKPFGLHTEPSHHISNPPPSLITGQHSDVFEGDMTSMAMSECDPCPAPAPSVNWENMSNMSYSASQRGVPVGTINGRLDHYHHHPYPTGNPLHYHHQRHAGQHNGYPYSNRAGLPVNRPSRMHQYGHVRGRGYDSVETETMFSQSTMNTENQSVLHFEDRTPPGRPPSPATVTEYSERERPVPLTPTSRISEYSDEDLRED